MKTLINKQSRRKALRVARVASLTSRILISLGNIADTAGMLMTYRGRKDLEYYGFDLEIIRNEYAKKSEREAIRRLKQMRLLRDIKIDNCIGIALTKSGVYEYFRLRVLNAIPLPEGSNCVVMFDIPEDIRKTRGELRRFLKSAGFVQLQKSVWSSKLDTEHDLKKLFELSGIKKDRIRVCTIKE